MKVNDEQMKTKTSYWINQCYLMRREKLQTLGFEFTSMTGRSLNNIQSELFSAKYERSRWHDVKRRLSRHALDRKQ